MSNPNWGQQPPQGPQGPQWGQPQQPPPGYGQGQYGQGQYGQPQYGQPQYGQPPYGQPAGGPPRGGSGGSKGPVLAVLGVAVVAGLVVLTLFLTGVLGSDGDGSSPSAAVESVLSAAKDKDIDAVKANLCQRDIGRIDGSPQGELFNTGIEAYTVGSTSNTDDSHALVEATVTVKGRKLNQSVPVVKEDGDWKVCFSEATAGGSSDGDDSDTGPATTGQPTDRPSYGGNGSYRIPSPGSTYTLPNGSTLTIPSLPALPSYGSS